MMRTWAAICVLTLGACAPENESPPATTKAPNLSPDSSDAEIMEHLYQAELEQRATEGSIMEEGPATSIMGKDPFEALVWIANELPRRGWHLHAGDFVVTGTVCVPPRVQAGDNARVVFTSLGSVSVDFMD